MRAPILAANRAHRAVHYSDLLLRVREKTGKQIALRTLEKYGEEVLQAKLKISKKCTAAERKCTRTSTAVVIAWLVSRAVAHVPLLCVPDRDSVSFSL